MILVSAVRTFSLKRYFVAKAISTVDDIPVPLAAISRLCPWAREMRLLPLGEVGASEL
jgi:hypothetical protein